MQDQAIVLPACALALLTMIVQFTLMKARGRAIRKARVRVQAIADLNKFDQVMAGTEDISDNFENLFELPILFYVATALILGLHATDTFYVIAAWTFVILRYAHSLIHCTYNNVMHRFLAWFSSSIILWIIWGRIAYQVLK